MAPRLKHLDLISPTKSPTWPSTSPRQNLFHTDLPSPRIGEIPPALSPLDAFALQSRMLARKFDESQQQGRPLSRLPHLEIANELAKRPGYFRSATGTPESTRGSPANTREQRLSLLHVGPEDDRPVSIRPMLSDTGLDRHRSPNDTTPSAPWPEEESDVGFRRQSGYFGISLPRASSPEQFELRADRAGEAFPVVQLPSLTGSVDSLASSQTRSLTNESTSSPRRRGQGLAPPASPFGRGGSRSAASIRCVTDSADEDVSSMNEQSILDPPRKFSGSTGVSTPPLTPDAYPGSYSPSLMSQRSGGSTRRGHTSRPSLNFSRPMSRPSSPSPKAAVEDRTPVAIKLSFEFPARKGSLDYRSRSPLNQSLPSTADDMTGTPEARPAETAADVVPTRNEGRSGSLHRSNTGAASYIYAKYSLPRGRTIEKGTIGNRESWLQHQFTWEEPAEPEPAQTLASPGSPQAVRLRSRSSPVGTPENSKPMHKVHFSLASGTTKSSNRTIQGHNRNSPSEEIANMSPEQHLEMGIECHSSGSLSKSTYHLRLAAKAGLPTAMLLYALACRHGWGMRPSPAEGVMWLRSALESSSTEFLAEEDPLTRATPRSETSGNPEDRQTRKGQFALAVYELGMSYMNGWGITKDKALAVRCFETAGSWGDCDALAEAGFCYTEGVGCKKDPKKAAAFYRQAADKGMSMAGNSWIYKPKYMDSPGVGTPVSASTTSSGAASPTADRPGKGSRSRARTLFGRKKTLHGV